MLLDCSKRILRHQRLDLERFVEGYSMSSGPKFKFIEKTQEISDFRGDKAEDGLIRIEFQFENKHYQISCWATQMFYYELTGE